ncbi:OmpH family outer membrane protein [Sphingomonas sp. LY29]|uniref:OmpH family outer membrane protein n=1 Tax=unclassified Sphingomonas TaxID=196159 RepID=UPI002ADECFC4|nr:MULTISPECIES: OmpH family outer membrane protein [unclassified Sphingomonas]MEA1071132.1 OmpH family outer membrane protein [Sphingomonas sp. LY160]WRP26147.1 OmpH family outer membrane protein [Sphingomonas sp. LY29]
MSIRLSAALVVASVIATPVLAQTVPAARVAVVDTTRIARDCTACRAAGAQLTTQENTLRTRAQALQTQLQTEGAPIQTAVNALNGRQPDAALQARITAFETKQRAAQTELTNGQRNLQSIQANVNSQIGTRLVAIVNTVAAQRGANIAIDKGSALYSAAAIDITDGVLAALNQQLPSVSVTPLPQQQQAPQGR